MRVRGPHIIRCRRAYYRESRALLSARPRFAKVESLHEENNIKRGIFALRSVFVVLTSIIFYFELERAALFN